MKNIKFILIALLLVNYSCDSYLDVDPQGQVVNDELFTSSEGFEEALAGVYSALNSNTLYGRNLSYYIPDVLAQYYANPGAGKVTEEMYSYDYMDVKLRPLVDGIWNKMYTNISHVNNVLKNLENFDSGSMRHYNVYKAEALGLRAFMHFDLLRLFSVDITNNPGERGIPYYEKFSVEVSEFGKIEDTYGKVIADLKAAELLYNDTEYFGEANDDSYLSKRNLHLNLYAIQATLARVYWTKGELENAAAYAEKVIDSGVFSLVDKTELEDFVSGVVSPKETIFGLFSNSFNEEAYKYLYYNGNNVFLDLKGNYEDFYNADKEGEDFRFLKWIQYVVAEGVDGNRCMKLVDTYKIPPATARPLASVEGINMIRLPEMYYIAAEYYLNSDQDKARFFFDQVLESRGLIAFADRSNPTLSLENILNERRKEFICEGQYFFAMKKYNLDIFEFTKGITYEASNDIYVLPIPDSEFEYRN